MSSDRALQHGVAATVLLACLAASGSTAARPGPRSRVAIVKASTDASGEAEVRTRLRAELTANGYEVVDAKARRDPRVGVEAALEECDAVAAFALVSIDDGAVVDVWLSDAVTHKTLVRRFVGGFSDTSRLAPSLLAVQAVELLHASLVELEADQGGEQSAGSTEPGASAECRTLPNGCSNEGRARPEKHGASGHRLEAGLAMPVEEGELSHPFQIGGGVAVGGVRELGTQGGPTASLSYVSQMGLGARATLVGPMFGAEITGARGSATIRETKVTASATYRLECVPDVFRLEPYIGGGGQQVYAEGKADPPDTPVDESKWSFALDLGVRASLWVDPRLAFELGAHGSFTVPGVELRIAGEPIAFVDRPAVYGTLGFLLAP